MRRSLDATSIGGWLCLVATLVLASPGVRVVRADDALVSEAPSGPVCSANAEPAVKGDELAEFLEQWKARALAEAARNPDADVPIALNNRGYNYGGPSGAEIDDILQQLRAEQRRLQQP